MYLLRIIEIFVLGISKFISNILNYKLVYKVVGFFATRKFTPAKDNHKYAILIAARNEEKVIGKLIESIRKQDYPAELVDIFVVADNCTDNTAEVSRNQGAAVYERFDNEHRTKGFALQYLVECIRKDYGIEAYEAYFIFDADNLLAPDYISRMNDSFDAGEKIVTSYRNTKNFGDNWISASYALHWLRTVRNEHRARSLFRLATRIQGTGFMFANEVIKDGWNYTSLTEDRAFCADAVVNGYTISFNYDAIFYDEQPIDIKTAMRQRIRWAKGHLQAFAESGGKLFAHIFVPQAEANRYMESDMPVWKKAALNFRYRFMSFDMLTTIYPRSIFLFARRIIVYLITLIGYIVASRTFGAVMALTGLSLWWAFKNTYKNIVVAIYVFLMENKRIECIPFWKKVWFCITFPVFDLIGRLSMVIALFSHVEWKPIAHNEARGIDDITLK